MKCPNCQEEFIPHKYMGGIPQKFCSHECMKIHHHKIYTIRSKNRYHSDIEYNRRYRERKAANMGRKTTTARMTALIKISGAVICSKCSSDQKLEIHHIYFDGYKDNEIYTSRRKFYIAICNGVRKTDDLDVLCEKCHDVVAREWLELSGQLVRLYGIPFLKDLCEKMLINRGHLK